MFNPLVSIVIPVYNGSNYLREAIDSALSQTYKNIEVIVINDGSCDNGATEEIALSYGDRIRYFYKENGGVATALNLAINEMKGEYFSWLSHDDLYYPNKVERQILELSKNQEKTAVVFSAYDFFNEDSKMIDHVLPHLTYPIENLTNSVFSVLNLLVFGCSLLIHKSQFKRVGCFDESLLCVQDYDLWFKMFRYQRIIYIDEPLTIRRLHGEQGSRTIFNFSDEVEQLFMGYFNMLTEDEIYSMYGDLYNFFFRMSCFFMSNKLDNAYHIANKKFFECNIPDNLEDRLGSFSSFIKKISGNKTSKICIFCAGKQGMRTLYELQSRLINVDYFSDNDTQKCGKYFNNIICITPEKLEIEKDHTLVIVSTRTPLVIVEQLKSKGYPYVITKQELEPMLWQTPPLRLVAEIDDIDIVDFT